MNKKLFFLAIAALGLAACSNDDVVEINQSEAISFRPLTNNVTRASSVANVTTANLASFTVNAMQTSSETPYFSNAIYTGTSGGTFTCSDKHYWPGTESLDFYAYAPAGNGQVTYTNYKTFTVTPTAGTDPENQVDLVYAATKGKNKGSNSDGVVLNFRHTGAKIVCKVLNTSSTLKFGVEGWKVGYLNPSGTFVFADSDTDGNNTNDGSGTTLSFGQWTPGGTKAVGVEYASTFTKVNITASAAATDLGGEFILIPQRVTAATGYQTTGDDDSKLNGTFIAVKLYALNNTNSYLVAGGGTTETPTTIWAIWPIGDDGGVTPFNWEPGKKYTYTIDLAGCGYYYTDQDDDGDLDPLLDGAEIKFVSVKVDAWDTDIDGDGTPGDEIDVP